ncbi:uncharacterized protein N7496_001379 [Penicillium cataractarum]|uniref:Uncharacterized protein n=1 Tax=Penicillium cataractarum TaxID=2100454 RepID=A0A9W9VVV5_9EURO|nr:uncharacterized protein N7496_001379 [Penicillium cataractarum]KAJ5390311.1 hypothetical protein N7496_001379 [Penicillium cataractarum]
MAHHGHRHDRISRLIRAKHRLETSETDSIDSNQIGSVDTIQDPVFASDILSSDTDCDPLQNTTCLDDVPDTTVVVLSKRQETQTPTTTVVETVVEVVDTNSQTLWQSSGVNFPMTISDSAFGTLTLTGSSITSTDSMVPSSAANATATQSISSQSTESLVPTTKQLAAISSPRASSSAISSVPYTSTRLILTSSSTTTTTSLPTSTASVFMAGNYYSSASSSTTISFTSDTSYSSYNPTSTSGFGGSDKTGSGTDSGSGSGSGSAPTTSQTQSSSGSGSGIDPTTSKIVGGVVGSVAGLAMIVLLLFYLFRRRKLLLQQKAPGTLPLPSDDGGTTREVTTRSSNEPLFTASYLAPAFMKRWRQSTMTMKSESTVSSSNPSERGFQKISGRKIPPVLTHGGDGYGGGLDGDSPTIPGFPPMSPAGGPATSPSSQAPPTTSPYGMVLDTRYTQEAEERAESPVRPSPVQLPISSSVNFGVATTVTPSHPIAQPQSAIAVMPQRPDGLGRSLASHDGSRSSRFTESIDR